MQFRVIKYLAQHHNLKTVILERGISYLENINRYVLGGGDTNVINNKNLFSSIEEYKLFTWIRNFNSKLNEGEKIYVYGCETTYTKNEFWIQRIREEIRAEDISDTIVFKAILRDIEFIAVNKNNRKNIHKISRLCNLLKEQFKNTNNLYEWYVDLLYQSYFYSCYDHLLTNKGRINREKFMCDNIKQIDRIRGNGQERIVVIAHNGYICNKEKIMGGYLKDKYSCQYYILGAIHNRAKVYAQDRDSKIPELYILQESPSGTLGYLFTQTEYPNFYLDIKGNLDSKTVSNFLKSNNSYYGSGRYGFHKRYVNLAKQFDGLIFIDNVNAATIF